MSVVANPSHSDPVSPFVVKAKELGLDLARLPQHVAIIMDGNGRWATSRYLPRVAGHAKGVESVRAIVKACVARKISYLTLSP